MVTLPLDIVHTILLILPTRSLMRFKTVCKSWNAIISDRSLNQNILVRNPYVLPEVLPQTTVVEKEATSTITLPLDIVHTILLVLPARSLKRFKTVCKSWNAIISDNDFVKNHLRRSKSMINQNILVMRSSCVLPDGQLRLVKSENGKFQVEAIEERRNLYPGKLLCSSDDGLLLISNYTNCITPHELWLWNPSSQQQTRISRPQGFDVFHTTFGFCRGPDLDNYKIVARYNEYYGVFSYEKKVWTMKSFPYTSTNVIRQGGVFVDGFCFFVMVEFDREIVYFDPRDETFNKLQKPRENKDLRNFFLTSLRGCLCLYYDMRFGNELEIWIRDHSTAPDSNSWTKYIVFDFRRAISTVWSIRVTPLFLTEKNELVMLSDYGPDSEFGIYNSMNEKYEKLDVPISTEKCYLETVPYVDSLFFPIR